MQNSRRSYANKLTRVRNTVIATQTVAATPRTSEGTGQIALGSYIFARIIN